MFFRNYADADDFEGSQFDLYIENHQASILKCRHNTYSNNLCESGSESS